MTDFEEHLWSRLISDHGADSVRAKRPDPAPRQRRRGLVVGGATACAAVVAAVVTILALTATGATPKAYALTQNANGSYTLTINDLVTALPQVNAKLAQLGIRAVAIPVTSSCTAKNTAGIPLLGAGAGSLSQTVTLSNSYLRPGWTEFIAAEQTPAGVRETVGSTGSPLPSCLSSNQAPPVMVDPTSSSSTTSGTTTN
jgi:hypothetical protein